MHFGTLEGITIFQPITWRRYGQWWGRGGEADTTLPKTAHDDARHSKYEITPLVAAERFRLFLYQTLIGLGRQSQITINEGALNQVAWWWLHWDATVPVPMGVRTYNNKDTGAVWVSSLGWNFLEPSYLIISELTFTFAICYRPSVCRLSSVTFVRPTQAIEIFGNVSTPFGSTFTICDLSIKILRRSFQGTPPSKGEGAGGG